MPRLISEIASGQQFSRSATEGKLTDSQVRTFRILLNQPGEAVDVQEACGITIGARHPANTNIYCVSWDAKFDGDSRTVIVATFNYQSTASSSGEDRNDQPPELRPANWSTSTSLIEVPAKTWTKYNTKLVDNPNYDPEKAAGPGNPSHIAEATKVASSPATNPAGDFYDGVSRFEAIVTILIEQFEEEDPTRHCLLAGSVNENEERVGSLICFPGSLMFRGVQARPTVEAWGNSIRRGWTATYEFAFRRNHVEGLWSQEQQKEIAADIGWDIAVPQTGFNVKCFINSSDVEKAGMPLKHKDGRIEGWKDSVQLPTNVTSGQKARGMVLVHEYENGGASQLPCAQPIPLNDDGSPRSDTANPKVKVHRYRLNEMVDFKPTFKLKLQ